MTQLKNLDDLEASWAEWMVEKNDRGKLTQGGTWRRDNPGEWEKLRAYYDGKGERPSLGSRTGKQMVELVDGIIEARGEPEEPPPTKPPDGTVRLPERPPHYVGGDPREIGSYTGLTMAPEPTFTTNGGFRYALDNTKDYFLPLGLKEWSSAPFPPNSDFRTQIALDGGGDIVIVGGEARFHSTNWIDDSNCLRVLGGRAGATVYCEGLKLQAVNGPTWSSPRNGVFQYCWIKAELYKDNHASYPTGDGCHPDIFQVWTGGVEQAHIRMNYVSGFTRFTGMTQLIGNLKRWTRNNVDLHFMVPQAGGQQVGNYMNYMWTDANFATVYDGGHNNWMDLGYWGGIREQLQMAISHPVFSYPPYVIRRGTQEWGPSTDPNGFRGALVSVGATQGDEHRMNHPNVTERWKWGKPTAADGADGDGTFVDEAKVGVGYVPVGYQ